MMKNVETDISNGDNEKGASGMNLSAFEEPESSPDTEKMIPSMNLPHLKIPKVEQDAEDTSVEPLPEVPISVRDKAKISYVYSSQKNKAPVVPPSPSTEPVSPTGASASGGEDGGAPAQSFPTSPAPEKVNPGREEPAPSRPSASSTTTAAAWPQLVERIRRTTACTEDSNIAGLEIEEIPCTKVDAPPSPPRPFKIGCAPPGAGWDDNRTFLYSSETDDEDLKKVKELHAKFEELNVQVAKYNEVSFSCRFILCDKEVSCPDCSLLKK